MKKVYYFLFAAMGLASCSNEDVFEAPANVNEKVAHELDFTKRSYSEALEIAKNSISMLQGNADVTRGESGRTLDLNNVKTYCQKTTRANGTSANDTLLYVFNFNDNQGFAVVSANRATDGLLAVVEKGSYDPNSKWGDSFALECLDNIKQYVAEAKFEGCVTSEANQITRATGDVTRTVNYSSNGANYVTESTELHKVAPKKMAEWAQRGEIARFCSINNIAGSGPIAAVQVMAYYGYPTSFKATYSNGSARALYWDTIKTYNNSYKYSNAKIAGNRTFESFEMLVREIGYRSEAQYKSNGTFTDIYKLKDCMKSFYYTVSGVDTYTPNNNSSTLYMAKKLNNKNFVIMQGSTASGTTHTFVISGCNYYRQRELYEDLSGNILYVISDKQVGQNYINWGEGGMYNGYYNHNLFCPVTYNQKDSNVNTNDKANKDAGYDINNFYNNLKYFAVSR